MSKRWLPYLLIFFTLLGCLSSSLPGQAVPDDRAGKSPQEHKKPIGKALYHYARARLYALDNHLPEAAEALDKAIKLDPRSSYLRMIMAELQLALGDEKQAVRSVEDALIQDPDYIDAHLLLGSLLLNRQDFKGAIQHLNRAVELDPTQEKIYLQLAVAYVRVGDTDGAIAILKRQLVQNPASVSARMALARLYRQLGLTALAEQTYSEFIDQHPLEPQGYAELARLYQSLGKGEQALATIQRGISANPSEDGIRYQLVRVLVELGQIDQALGELRVMLEENPARIEAQRLVGLLLIEKKDWEAAGEAFQQLLVLEPLHDQGLFYLGMVRENQERWPEAIAVFEKIASDSDFFLDATSHLGYLYYRTGQIDKAIQLLELRLHNTEGRSQLFTFLASLYEEKDDMVNAGAWLKKGLEVFPESADLYYHRGLLLERQGDRKGALADMRRAIELDNKYYEAMNFIAYSYAEQGEQLEEALNLARRALEFNNEGHIVDTLGWVLFKMGRFSEARGELETAAALLPKDALVLEHLGDLYLKLELLDKASAIYGRALELSPDNEQLRKKLQQLAPR
jgi:tetratricopeptide (TPR) repeat protein